MDKTINKDIIYIGCDDKEITQFEGQYMLEDGMCYNSYLIKDEKVAIMDTVDKAKKAEWLSLLEKSLNGKTPDYIVVQHVEPDHSSVLSEVVEKYPSITVVCSAAAQKMLPLYFPEMKLNFHTVKEGDELKLGKNTLKFFTAPMVHWPEVIVTYAVEAKVLFSADGFGKFGVYDSEPDDWSCEARRYYFNICGKYGAQVQALLKKAATLDIETICPLHGPILKGEMLKEAVRLYDIWSKYEVETEGVFIAYCTMHSNTGNAAEYLAEVLKQKTSKHIAIANLCEEDWAEALEDAFRHDTLVLAAPTYDGGLFPKMVDFIHHLKIKNFQKRKIAFIENGSWAPQAARLMKELVKDFKELDVIEQQVTIRGAFKEADKKAVEELAEKL
ncbi:MAG: FprA family A-type flavoprotein [Bacteroidales bacterium]|nr:FprA family A-type flavoprotein [Bacteroidales bacterium]